MQRQDGGGDESNPSYSHNYEFEREDYTREMYVYRQNSLRDLQLNLSLCSHPWHPTATKQNKKKVLTPLPHFSPTSQLQADCATAAKASASVQLQGQGWSAYAHIGSRVPYSLTRVFAHDAVDRRPIDPPPIVQLHMLDAKDEDYLQNPYFFMNASIVTADYQELNIVNGNPTTAGTVVQSLYRLKDVDNTDGGFFIFPDMSVRVEGKYRIKFSLYLIQGYVYLRLLIESSWDLGIILC
ncbi:velvet factor-domain-containing protein [Endogone sp. FLAS-F59071]|nr:velvet factor-domain-containing protein [Endogone sp. FLAS-F59071]|eukprot:RUS14606.1 velvet factor-domain-containing protein [Endogone sp. FLAS-F59071]